jgi:AmmeMemoRadiSam system protein A
MLLPPQHCRLLLDVARGTIRERLSVAPGFGGGGRLPAPQALSQAIPQTGPPPVPLANQPTPGPSPPTAAPAADAHVSTPPGSSIDAQLSQPAGCFVSLHSIAPRRLRGCVGKIEATDPLLQAVRAAAVAVLDDPRFRKEPVRLEELPGLELEISVLSPLRPAAGPLEFDLLNDGVYLVHNGRAGCFLPQVARETGWSREQLLSRLCTEKLGCSAAAWQHAESKLFVFSTLLIGPEPFGVGR